MKIGHIPIFILDEMIFEYKIASQISHREKYWMFWLHLYTFLSSGHIPEDIRLGPGLRDSLGLVADG